MVLCIPRININISEQRIRKIFNDINLGIIERIDMRSGCSLKGEKYTRVFIHYREWNDTENARIAQERLSNGQDIKIIYDDPWYWKVTSYKAPEDRKPVKRYNNKYKQVISETQDEISQI